MGIVALLLMLRLLCPGLFLGLRQVLVDPRGEAAARAAFRAWEGAGDLRDGTVPVWGGATDD